MICPSLIILIINDAHELTCMSKPVFSLNKKLVENHIDIYTNVPGVVKSTPAKCLASQGILELIKRVYFFFKKIRLNYVYFSNKTTLDKKCSTSNSTILKRH